MITLKHKKQILIKLHSDLFDKYNAPEIKLERKILHKIEHNLNYSILGEIEIFQDTLAGFVSRIISDKTIDLNYIIAFLKKYNLFDIEYVSEWFCEKNTLHIHTKKYLQELDYLKYFIIDYCEHLLKQNFEG